MATGQTAGMQHFPQPDGLPPANGYSHAVAFTGRLVVISGQVPAGPDGQVVGAGDPAAQVRQVFTNLATALAAAGATLAQVVKLTIFLTDLADLAVLREVRDEFLAGGPPPADLRSPAAARDSISQVAARWGVHDMPHFSRAFRARYGMTPSQARHAGPAAGEPRRSAPGQPGRVDD